MGKKQNKWNNNKRLNRRNQRDFPDKPKKEHFKNGKKNNEERQTPKNSLREDQVGITEFVNKSIPGFIAVIKSRYSDFHVNEIDLENKVLVLNDLNMPQPKKDTTWADIPISEAREQLKEIISEENWLKIEQLAAAEKDDTSVEPIEINISELDKEKRTQIHEMLKKFFNGKLVSLTVTKEIDSSTVRYLRISKAKGGRAEKRFKWAFPADYVKFLVHKENLDTTEVATHMARNLSLVPSKINYCGTKDKRAITTQMFCVKRRSPFDIASSVKFLRSVRVGNFSFSYNVLKLGELRGNRFRIALRHINADKDLMVTALEQLKQYGFINFFGMQRFGNCADIPTYEIGIALMKADYKTACELILKPRDGDIPFLKTIRETWWKDRNSKEAAGMFHSERFIEKKLLDGLAKHGENDYATALRKLPRNLLLLYPHAFQSLIFNRIASRRIKEHGLKLMLGDLVYCNPNDEIEDEKIQAEILVDDDDDDTDDKTLDEAKDEAENATGGAEKNIKADSPSKLKVHALTAEDISSNKYSIYDVVLPLPGFDVQYPANELSDWYKEALAEHNLTSESFNHNIKTFKLSGAYRKLLMIPKDLTWEFCCYDKPDAQLIDSDLNKLKKKECAVRIPFEKFETDNTLHKALIIEFSLPPAAYATMLLRELLKADTSSANQSNIEIEAKAKKELDLSAKIEKTKSDDIKTSGAEKRPAEPEEESDIQDAPSVKVLRTD